MQKIFTKEFRPGEKWSGFIGKQKYIHFKALDGMIQLPDIPQESEPMKNTERQAIRNREMIITDVVRKTLRLNLSEMI